MSHKNHITQAQLEALIDGELAPEERALIETHAASCECCRDALHQYKREQAAWTAAWQARIDEATAEVDWDLFEAKVMAQVERKEHSVDVATPCQPPMPVETPTPVKVVAPTLAWHQRLFGWIKDHPGLLVASAATAGILLLFALPALDPGPQDKDVIVDRVIKSKTAKVSVLRSTNQATGRPVTVIVIKEPPSETNVPPHKAHPSPKRQP